MPWQNPQSGELNTSAPEWRGKSSSSEVYWPDAPAAAKPNIFGTAPADAPLAPSGYRQPQRPQTGLEVAIDKATIKVVRFLFTWVLGAAVLVGLVWFAFTAVNARFAPVGTVSRNAMTYKPADIERFYDLPWHRGEFLVLSSPNVVIDGSLSGAMIRAAGNVIVRGDVKDSSIVAKDGVIKGGSITNSALTADDIFLTGSATNSHQWIDGYVFSHGKKTAQRTRPFPIGYRYLQH